MADYPPHPNGVGLRPIEDTRFLLLHHASAVRSHQVTALEDRIAAQRLEIQSLLVDNQRLVATHVAIKQDVALAQQELRQLSSAAGDVKAERDAQVREVYERSLKLEADARSINAMVKELAQMRVDVQKLISERKQLEEELQLADAEVARARADSKQAVSIKAEMELLHREIQRGRMAIELEKKTHQSNLEHTKVMGRNKDTLAHEIEKLRVKLINADKRERASAAEAVVANAGICLKTFSSLIVGQSISNVTFKLWKV
ncbi:hypothetical protein SAY86_026076 [Trapa natans]|uniref:Uncharacterized protein n=1 Tax=Trapa natans TaxID=22666 RepID=A0AAN7QE70_TRANT|nr:hypothetical protein SAY86_026076 [Trapa natans]